MQFRFPVSIMVAFAFIPAVLSEEQPPQQRFPDPITIRGAGGPPAIPDMPRDRVICFALYTVQKKVLKLSAQLYPLKDGDPRNDPRTTWRVSE